MTCCMPNCRKPASAGLWANDPPPKGRHILWFCAGCADYYEAKGYERAKEEA